jgi:hypothetical protein
MTVKGLRDHISHHYRKQYSFSDSVEIVDCRQSGCILFEHQLAITPPHAFVLQIVKYNRKYRRTKAPCLSDSLREHAVLLPSHANTRLWLNSLALDHTQYIREHNLRIHVSYIVQQYKSCLTLLLCRALICV